AHGEIGLAWKPKLLAFRIHTRYSIEVGSLHEVLLEYSWALSQRLHTTRRLLSISVMITGHYQLLRERHELKITCFQRVASSGLSHRGALFGKVGVHSYRGTVESITVGASFIGKNTSLQVAEISPILRYRRF